MHACSKREPKWSTRTRSPSTAASPRSTSGRRRRARILSWRARKRSVETMDSFSMRSRWGEDLHEGGGIQDQRPEATPRLLGEDGRLADHVHVEEARLEEKLEVALESRLRILHDGDPGELDACIEAIDSLDDQRVGVDDAHLRE